MLHTVGWEATEGNNLILSEFLVFGTQKQQRTIHFGIAKSHVYFFFFSYLYKVSVTAQRLITALVTARSFNKWQMEDCIASVLSNIYKKQHFSKYCLFVSLTRTPPSCIFLLPQRRCHLYSCAFAYLYKVSVTA